MKKFSRLLFVLLLASCLLTPSSLLAKENSDNNEKIETLQKAGIITGYPDGSLGLDKPITRAEIAVILTKIKGELVEKNDQQIFNDVGKGHWAKFYVENASQIKNPQGISAIVGYPDGSFKPSNQITYAEILKILVAASKSDLTSADVKESTWPSSWIAWANSMGIIGPNSGIENPEPNKFAPRGHVFTMVYNAMSDDINKIESKAPENINEKTKELSKEIKIENADNKKATVDSEIGNIDSFNKGVNFNHDLFHQEFLKLINADRQNLGCDPLEWADDLTKGASIRSEELVANGSIDVNGKFHRRLDGRPWQTSLDYLEPQISTTTHGENLVEIINSSSNGNIAPKTRKLLTDEKFMAKTLYDLWWNSPGHRDNMMNPKFKYLNLQLRLGDHAKNVDKGKRTFYFVGTTHFRGDYK
ncbi:MAG: S-layer homology domain-containing protein [Peptoniphilus sp.]|uniref:CAP and S-layer homology domain-containing protein n=1 Tax=Peptoniphilus sp. TaxID=1971214 RepID=UPI00399BA802